MGSPGIVLLALLSVGPPAEKADPAPARRPMLRPTLVAPRPTVGDRSARDRRARELGLKPAGLGYEYRGGSTEPFDARIAADGTVEFKFKRGVQVKLDGVCLMAVCKRTRAGRQEIRRRRRQATAARAIALGLLEGMARSTVTAPRWYGQPVGGPIEGSELPGPPPFNALAAQGRYGNLPAPHAAMGRFMDRTFDLRLEMAQAAAQQALDAARRQLDRTLVAIWSDAYPSAAERKAAILRLWESFDPGASHVDPALATSVRSTLDAQRREQAAAARRRITHAVAENLPEGHPDAFTVAELAEFNAGVSTPFQPYGAPPP